MKDLGIYVISWNRPHFLAQTVESLKARIAEDVITADIHIIDNGSNAETVSVINNIEGVEKTFFDTNRNIGGGYQDAIPDNVDELYKYILTTDHDFMYLEPLSTYIRMLKENPLCFLAKGHNQPLHAEEGRVTVHGREWFVKKQCSAGTAVMRTEDWQKLRPLPRGQNYDWHIVGSMTRIDKDLSFYVLPGTALHTGWRKGDSTWQPGKEIPGDQYLGDL